MPNDAITVLKLISFVFCIWFVVNFDRLLHRARERRMERWITAGDRYIAQIDKITNRVR